MNPVFDTTTKVSTAGGTLLTILLTISKEDILKTMLLAAIGATVSFIVTMFLKWLIRLFKRKR